MEQADGVDGGKRAWLKQVLGVEMAAPGGGDLPGFDRGAEVEDGNDLADVADFIADFIKKKDWKLAANFINGLKQSVMAGLLKGYPAKQRAALLDAALKDKTNLGESSQIAIELSTVDHPVISPEQSGRAGDIAKKLSPEDQKKYQDLLDKAKTPKEKSYLTKGLAAGHTVAELDAFAGKIAGKDDKWMQDNLSLTGHSDGKGVKQQWSHSCGPTTFEAVMGELDPLYALKMVEENPNLTEVDVGAATAKNPKMAEDQRKMLAGSQYGVAVDRNHAASGVGMWITDNLNKTSASTGLKYESKKFAGDGTELPKAIVKLNEAIDKGEPVPIVVGNTGHPYAHYMLVTGSTPGPPRYYTIHDPWEGKTYKRSEDQMKTGKLAFGALSDLQAMELPSRDDKPAAAPSAASPSAASPATASPPADPARPRPAP